MKNKNSWFEIKAAAYTTEIYIYDEIGSWGVSAKDFIDQLNEIKSENIDLRLNTPGGSVFDGNAIYNALKRHDAKITTHIDGLAASMGSVIALAGDTVNMADNALYMIHNPTTVALGDADELRSTAAVLDKLKSSMLRIYSDRSKFAEGFLSRLMDEETWYTAEDAKEAGFVDSIVYGLPAAASFDKSKFEGYKRTPDSIYYDLDKTSLNSKEDAIDYTKQLINLKKSQLIMSIVDRKTT